MQSNLRRMCSILVSLFLVLSIGFVLFLTLFPNLTTRDDARAELLNFRSSLAVGMDKVEVDSLFVDSSYKHLRLAKATENLWMVQTPFQAGAVNWELRLAFVGRALTGYFVRSADDDTYLPHGAPSDEREGGKSERH